MYTTHAAQPYRTIPPGHNVHLWRFYLGIRAFYSLLTNCIYCIIYVVYFKWLFIEFLFFWNIYPQNNPFVICDVRYTSHRALKVLDFLNVHYVHTLFRWYSGFCIKPCATTPSIIILFYCTSNAARLSRCKSILVRKNYTMSTEVF